MADGTLLFETKLDNSGLVKGLKGVDSSLAKVQKTSALALTGLTTGFAGATMAGVKFNAEVEKYTTTFSVFTGSAEKGAEVMDRLVKLGASTPFETIDLANATQTLMSFGFTADSAVESLTMLGNASQGDAQKMQTLTKAFGRMSSSGKVTLEDINMMIDSGFNPLQQVAEDTGMSMGEIYEAISDGEIKVEQVTSAMQKMTGEGGQYFGLMEKQSKTWNGMLSTLSDTIQMKLGEATKALFDEAKAVLPKIIEWIDGLDVNQVINGCITLVGVLASIYGSVTLIRGVVKTMEIATTIQDVVIKAGGLSGVITNVSANIVGMASAFSSVVGPIMGVVALIALFGTTLMDIWNTNEAFRKAVIECWNGITETLSIAYETIIKPVFDQIIVIIQGIIQTAIIPLWNVWKECIASIISLIMELWNAVKPIVDWLVMVFGPLLSGVIQGFADMFGATIEAVIISFTQFFTSIKSGVDAIRQVLQGLIQFIVGVFTGNWAAAWQGVVNVFGGIVNGLVAVFKGPINGVIGLVNSAINALNRVSVTVPDWVPVVGGKHFGISIPNVPYLEKGGILRKGQVGLLEGSGAEAVVPLEKNKAWIRAVAKDMAKVIPSQISNNKEQTVNIYQPVQSPAEIARALRLADRYGLAGA